MKRQLAIAMLVCLLVLSAGSVAWACPSCQAALANDPDAGDYASGIYYSILFMLSMPFAIVGAWAGFIYRAVKRSKQDAPPLPGEPTDTQFMA